MILTTVQIVFRLLLSAVLAGIIGLEREYRHKPAGLRTNILVGVGSTLVMLTSLFVSGQDGDPTKLAYGVITGIGFLGAGVIIRGHGDKEDDEMVHGITTAATIWLVSAVGLAVGLGFYFAAIFTTLIALAVLYGLNSDRIRSKMEVKHKDKSEN
ncbi:MAG: MgtC/SapB family protein [Patescibacteria group bacterium]